MPVSMTVPQLRRGECTLDGKRIHLTRKQADLLALLLVTPPARFVPIQTLIVALWPNPDVQPETARKCVDQHLNALRDVGVPIETADGKGWGWRVPAAARGRPTAEQQRAAA